MLKLLRLSRDPIVTLSALGKPQELDMRWRHGGLLYLASAPQHDVTVTTLATPSPELGEALLACAVSGRVRRAAVLASQHEMRFRAMQSVARMDVLPVLQRTASLTVARLTVGQHTRWLERMSTLADLADRLLEVCPTRSVLSAMGAHVRDVLALPALAEYEIATREFATSTGLDVDPHQNAAGVLELVDASVALASSAVLLLAQRRASEPVAALRMAEDETPPQALRLQRAVEPLKVGSYTLQPGDLLGSSTAASEGHAVFVRIVALTLVEEAHRLWSFGPQATTMRRVRQAVLPMSLIGLRRSCALREVSAEVPTSILLELGLRAA